MDTPDLFPVRCCALGCKGKGFISSHKLPTSWGAHWYCEKHRGETEYRPKPEHIKVYLKTSPEATPEEIIEEIRKVFRVISTSAKQDADLISPEVALLCVEHVPVFVTVIREFCDLLDGLLENLEAAVQEKK